MVGAGGNSLADGLTLAEFVRRHLLQFSDSVSQSSPKPAADRALFVSLDDILLDNGNDTNMSNPEFLRGQHNSISEHKTNPKFALASGWGAVPDPVLATSTG